MLEYITTANVRSLLVVVVAIQHFESIKVSRVQ